MSTDVGYCDYCGTDLEPGRQYIRPIGFTWLNETGPPVPLVRMWCGRCGDECPTHDWHHEGCRDCHLHMEFSSEPVDPEALAAVRRIGVDLLHYPND